MLVILLISHITDFKDDFYPGIVLSSTIVIWIAISVIVIWQSVGIWARLNATGKQKNYGAELLNFLSS